jgi:hypothetical protein
MQIFARKQKVSDVKKFFNLDRIVVRSELTGECILITQNAQILPSKFTLDISVYYENHEGSVRQFSFDLDHNEAINSPADDFPIREIKEWRFTQNKVEKLPYYEEEDR